MLLYLQSGRNELGVQLCEKILNSSDLQSDMLDIAYIRGKLDLLTSIIADSDVNTSIIKTDE